MDSDRREIIASDYLTMSEPEWEQTRLRARVISQLAQFHPVTQSAADEAAKELGVSRRQVYEFLRRYRQGSGLVTDLISQRSSGGKGGSRLSEPVEQIIRETIRKRFLTR